MAGAEKEGNRGLRDKIQEVRGGQTMSGLEGHRKNFGSSSEMKATESLVRRNNLARNMFKRPFWLLCKNGEREGNLFRRQLQ